MSDKADALQKIVDIARRHNLQPGDIQRALSVPEDVATRRSSALTSLFAYIGGIFIFAGLSAFIGMNWEAMNSAARIIITLGSGVAAFVLALITLEDARYARATTPLFLIAGALQPTGMLIAFDELSSGGDWHHAGLIVSGVMLVQQALTFLKTRRTSLLFSSMVFGYGFLAVLLDLLGMNEEFSAWILGISMLCLSAGIDRTAHREITPLWYFAGSVMFLWTTFDFLENSPLEILFLAVTCGMVWLSTLVRSRTLLAVSTLAILGYVGYFTEQHFVNSIGWPLALVAFGLMMIGLSAVALKINKRYIRAEQAADT